MSECGSCEGKGFRIVKNGFPRFKRVSCEICGGRGIVVRNRYRNPYSDVLKMEKALATHILTEKSEPFHFVCSVCCIDYQTEDMDSCPQCGNPLKKCVLKQVLVAVK